MRIAQQTTACDAYHAHRGAGFAASQRAHQRDAARNRGSGRETEAQGPALGDPHPPGRADGETTGVDL